MIKQSILTFAIVLSAGVVSVAVYHAGHDTDSEPAVALPAIRPAPSPTIAHGEPTTAPRALPESSPVGRSTEHSPAAAPGRIISTAPSGTFPPVSVSTERPRQIAGENLPPATPFTGNATRQFSPSFNTALPVESPRSAPLPLAFRELPAEVTAANPQLASAVQGLQQNFVDAVGGTNQNPDDPAYYNRWMGALANADEQYRILVGNQAFLLEQTQVNNQ